MSESELHEIIVEIVVINVEIKILSNFGVLQTSDSSIINRITFLFTQIVIRFKVKEIAVVWWLFVTLSNDSCHYFSIAMMKLTSIIPIL